MAMHEVKVRFSGQLWEGIMAAAKEEGVSRSQFVRESVLGRLAWRAAMAQPDMVTALEQSIEKMRQPLEQEKAPSEDEA